MWLRALAGEHLSNSIVPSRDSIILKYWSCVTTSNHNRFPTVWFLYHIDPDPAGNSNRDLTHASRITGHALSVTNLAQSPANKQRNYLNDLGTLITVKVRRYHTEPVNHARGHRTKQKALVITHMANNNNNNNDRVNETTTTASFPPSLKWPPTDHPTSAPPWPKVRYFHQ